MSKTYIIDDDRRSRAELIATRVRIARNMNQPIDLRRASEPGTVGIEAVTKAAAGLCANEVG